MRTIKGKLMKTVLEDISSVKKKVMIEIEAEDVDKRVDDAYKRFGKKAKIRGFRPGKAPRKILERYFGDQVLEDVTNSLIKETLPKALEEAKAFPVNMPIVENDTLIIGKNYKYSAVMEVRPQFELKDYLGIEVEKEEFSVTDEDVDRQIEEIRALRGNLVPVQEERGIREGDYVIIDYEGFDSEGPIEGVKSQNFSLKIGSKRFYPGFEEALIGFKKGDMTEIALDFEADYFHSRLAGRRVNFKVHITDVKEIELPDLNDEFAKNLGGGFEGVDDLKKKVREELRQREEKRIDNESKARMLARISDSVDFELPESLVESEVNATLENIRQNLVRSGSSIEKAGLDKGKLIEEIRPKAEKSVKEMLVLGEISKQNNLRIDDKDLADGFEELSRGVGHSAQEMRRYYEASNLMDAFRQTLLKEKTLNFLMENATVKSVAKDKIDKE